VPLAAIQTRGLGQPTPSANAYGGRTIRTPYSWDPDRSPP